jgi:hypothetical protein
VENDMQAAQLRKIRAEIRKLSRKSDKLMMKTRWYPLVVTSGLFATIAVVIQTIT